MSLLFVLCVFLCGPLLAAEKSPLKVGILAGQSNMEGHAEVGTFDYFGDDRATAALLKQRQGADGQPSVCAQA